MSKPKKIGLWALAIVAGLTILGALLPEPGPHTATQKAKVRSLMPEKYQHVEEATQFRCEAKALHSRDLSAEQATEAMEECR